MQYIYYTGVTEIPDEKKMVLLKRMTKNCVNYMVNKQFKKHTHIKIFPNIIFKKKLLPTF